MPNFATPTITTKVSFCAFVIVRLTMQVNFLPSARLHWRERVVGIHGVKANR